MAVTVIGLHSAELTDGEEPTGQKTYIAQSDTQILGNVIDVLDATGIPVYDETYDPTATGLKVRTKRAVAMDEQEGYVWMVTVNYETPEKTDGQEKLDPRDRPWDWSKGPDKRQIVAPDSRFDTSGYQYPGSNVLSNINLKNNEAIVNTAELPFSDGVVRTISRQVITLTKYVDDYSGVGASSWEDLDSYIDSVNSGNKSILNVSYTKWQLLMDDINYAPHSENGFDVIRISFRIIADTVYTHVAAFPSQGYKQLKGGELVDILDKSGQPVMEPRLLDSDGLAIPLPSPVEIEPVYISAGLNESKDWAALSLPTSIP
jgi:hypothetical protein